MPSRSVAAGAAAVLLAVATLAAQPTPAAAIRTIPGETGVQLPSDALSAMVGDVDGDGVRELVRVLRWRNDPGRLAVEVTSVNQIGRLVSGGHVVLRRAASPEDVFGGGPAPDGDGMLAVAVDEPARLLTWHVDGAERVIVAGIGTEGLPRPCCLTLWEVGLSAAGETELRLLVNTQRSGASIVAVDLDGDGTDEVVVGEALEALRPNELQVDVLRWDGSTFAIASRHLSPALSSELVPLGDSDGRPGDELGLVAVPEEGNLPALLHRLSLGEDGAPKLELGTLPFLGAPVPMPSAGGGRIVLASPGNGLRLLAWPADGEIRVEGSSAQRGVPLGVLGAGDDARLLIRDGGLVRVLDEGFSERGLIERSDAATLFRNRFLAPYAGPLQGGLTDGRAAFVFRGRLTTTNGGDGGEGNPLSAEAMASLPGMTPIGLFGPDGSWTALAAATGFQAEREGGRLAGQPPVAPARVSVAATDDVLTPEADAGSLEPALHGAVADPRSTNGRRLLARGAFDVELEGPVGASVTIENGDGPGPQPVELGPDATLLRVDPPTPPGETDMRFSVRLQVVTLAGHGYVARWEVHVLREPPRLVTSTPIAPLSFSVLLQGRTDPAATVVIDGVPVAVDDDGRFETQVAAGPIPREVRIVVSDPVGNTTQRTVSVVGFVDFRRLPWIPVVAVLTVVAGAILYLRAPKPAARLPRRATDDATFEEIE